MKQWREKIVFDAVNRTIDIKRRTKGEKLLRAAAKGACQEEIEAIDEDRDTMTIGDFYEWCKTELRTDDPLAVDCSPSHFADAARYSYSSFGKKET